MTNQAGYIMADNNGTIHGFGSTPDAARADAIEYLSHAMILLVADDADEEEIPCEASWMRASDLRLYPASPALMAAVPDLGGDIAWRLDANRIAVLWDEEVA